MATQNDIAYNYIDKTFKSPLFKSCSKFFISCNVLNKFVACEKFGANNIVLCDFS